MGICGNSSAGIHAKTGLPTSPDDCAVAIDFRELEFLDSETNSAPTRSAETRPNLTEIAA